MSERLFYKVAARNNSCEKTMTSEEILEWYEKACAFHTKRAPGLAIGIAMVDMCRARLGPVKEKLNAISESPACLCDVIQLMTGCTMGNRYVKSYGEIGRFALTLYDRADGRGVRAYIDLDKISASKTPELHKFFLRQRSEAVKAGGEERLKSGDLVVKEFLAVRDQIIALQDVFIEKFGKSEMLPAALCKSCHESFLCHNKAEECASCSGKLKYYRPVNG
ncbi:MAG: hypothetical protein CVV41_14825 [Candidatus Riflebacteria bacterium HGW-Riflebacteria-1]|jgi:formylmethanofuran dehydrogenase subunit E|nr:MAG: hypothetical protein CVV41_14825 [Candidatus Riflebacteria bacterium HGW-Riflebacteria-1]